MKTVEEAARLVCQLESLERYKDLMVSASQTPEILAILLQIACMDITSEAKLKFVLAVGMAIGIEMEKR